MKDFSFTGIIGVSEGDITPPEGIYLGNWGAATSPVSTGIHYPLTMTCITFQNEEMEYPLILLGMDLGWWKDRTDEIIFRKALLDRFDLPESSLLVCLSHTHSGPSICRKDIRKPGGQLIEGYLKQLEVTAVTLINGALEKACESIVTWEYGWCSLAQNRDLKDPDKDRYLVGYNPEKSPDQTLLCGRITNMQGQMTGTIVNYACHPTTLGWENTLVSPDYIGSMRDLVRSKTHAPMLFIQGASGDLAPILQYSGDTRLADTHGRQLGYAVLSCLESMSDPGNTYTFSDAVESGAPLAVWTQERVDVSYSCSAIKQDVKYPLKDFPDYAELEKAWIDTDDTVQKERLWRKMGIRAGIGDGDEAVMAVWIWKLGGAYIVAQANEAYSVFQETVRTSFPGIPVVVGNLVNGSIGYFPPADLYKEDIYAVWQTPFAPGCLEILTRETMNILQELQEKS